MGAAPETDFARAKVEGKPLLVSDPGDMPVQKQMKKNGYASDSFLSLPLIHEGEVIGAIHLTNRRDKKAFTQEDVAAFSPIASEIALVLHKGLSFRESVKQFSTSIFHSLANAMEKPSCMWDISLT